MRKYTPEQMKRWRETFNSKNPGWMELRQAWIDRNPGITARVARKYAASHPDKRKESVKKWVDNNPEKRKAQNLVNNCLRLGKIEKPAECSKCGVSGVTIEGHHFDYSKPLDLVWLCRKCHANIGKEK